MEDVLIKNNIDFIIEDNQVMVKAYELAKFVNIKNIREIIKKYTDDERRLVSTITSRGKQKINYLTESGIKRLLCSSRKPMSVLLSRELGINIQHKYVHIETSFVIYIKKTFLGEEILEQYIIGNYILDLYFPKYNLAIEIDEDAHKFKRENDYVKEEYIRNRIGCKLLRIKESENIFEALNCIYVNIKVQ